MKIAFKNFITTLRRYKMASVLNIAGLTLAFLAFLTLSLFRMIVHRCSRIKGEHSRERR